MSKGYLRLTKDEQVSHRKENSPIPLSIPQIFANKKQIHSQFSHRRKVISTGCVVFYAIANGTAPVCVTFWWRQPNSFGLTKAQTTAGSNVAPLPWKDGLAKTSETEFATIKFWTIARPYLLDMPRQTCLRVAFHFPLLIKIIESYACHLSNKTICHANMPRLPNVGGHPLIT